MTISTTISRITYAGDGSASVFAVPFAFFGADEIAVIERNQGNGVETEKTLTTDYTVAGGAGQTGTVSAIVPLASGRNWTIYRRTARIQMVDYTPNDSFPAETHERALDRLTALVQELDDKLDRSAKLSPTATITNLTLPAPEAGRLIGWNDDLSGIENKTLPEGATVYASIATTSSGVSDGEAVTPRGLAMLWRKGEDIASAATLAAPAEGDRGGFHVVTGNNSIAALWPGVAAGHAVELCFSEALTLIHHPTVLALPVGDDIPVLAGDIARFRSEGSGNWRCVSAPPHWYGGSASTLSMPVLTKISAYTMSAEDIGHEIRFETAGVTFALLAAAACGNGAQIVIRNAAASGDVTVDPDGSETLDGQGTRKLRPGDCVLIRCDGVAWQTITGDYSYDSGEQVITSGGALTLAHGLGRKPYLLHHFLRCKTADTGWAVGDEVEVSVAVTGTGFNVHRSPGMRSDETSIALRYGSGASAFGYVNAGTGSEANLANANWRLIVRARAK